MSAPTVARTPGPSGWRVAAALGAVTAGCALVAGPVAAAAPLPPVLHPGRLGAWLAATDAAGAAFGLLGVLVLVGGGLLALGLAAEIGAQCRRPPWRRGLLRRALVPAPAAALVASLLAPPALARAGGSGATPPGAPALVMTEMAPGGAPGGSASPAPGPASFRVEPGGSFWAEAVRVAGSHGVGAADRRTARFWLRLVEAGQPLLVRPGDPDLVFPGQVLPEPPWDDPQKGA